MRDIYCYRFGRRLYETWVEMRRRCNNPNRPRYEDYGGRGIRVCAEWESFSAFADWAMKSGYTDELTIDRIDNDKGYAPDNCRFATYAEQNRNKRTNRKLTYDGQTKTVTEWSVEKGLNPNAVRERIDKLGWTAERALSTPRARAYNGRGGTT